VYKSGNWMEADLIRKRRFDDKFYLQWYDKVKQRVEGCYLEREDLIALYSERLGIFSALRQKATRIVSLADVK